MNEELKAAFLRLLGAQTDYFLDQANSAAKPQEKTMNEKERQEQLQAEQAKDFNATEAFVKEAEPLWRELYKVMDKHGVPGAFFACTQRESTRAVLDGDEGINVRNHVVGCRYFNGPDRTPNEFAVIAQILDEGLDAGMKSAAMLRLKALFEGGCVHTEAAETTPTNATIN